VLGSANIPSMILAAGALVAVFRFKANMIAVLGACSALGLIYYFTTGHAG
jgi:chromate transporter